jgi:lysophospholipase L1-like esterase
MRNLQDDVMEIIKDHKRRKRYVAFLTALSLIVSIIVPSALIMPAISMTREAYSGEEAVTEEIALVGDESDGQVISMDGIASTFDVYERVGNERKDVTDANYVANSDLINIEIDLNYNSTDTGNAAQGLRFSTGSNDSEKYNKMTFSTNFSTLGDALSLGKSGNVTDSNYSDYLQKNQKNDAYAGTFVIDSSGNIIVTLTDEYITYLKKQGNGEFTGTLSLEGTLSRSASESGDQTLNVGGKEVTVNFKDSYPKINSKSGWTSSDGKIYWTVDIDNAAYLNGYVFSDSMLAGAADIKINDTPVGSAEGVTFSDSTITFDSGTWSGNSVKITYTTDITAAQLQAGKAVNEATLVKNDEHKDDEDNPTKSSLTKEVSLGSPFSVTKSGTQDYKNGGTYNNKITWKIEVKSNYGTSLKDYVLNDAALSGAENVKVNGNAATVSNDGTITLTEDLLGDNVTSATITYDAPAVSGNNTNTATLKYPSSGGEAGKGSGDVTYQKEDELVTFRKDSNYSSSTHTITWKINVYSEASLAGYTVKDSNFPSNISDIKIVNGNNQVLTSSDVATLNGDTLTFNDGQSGEFTLEYTQTINTGSDATVSGTTVTNDASIQNQSSTTLKTATAKESITYTNTVSKKLNGDEKNQKEVEENTSGAVSKTLSWTVEITRDVAFSGLVYTDTISVDRTDATHTLIANTVKVSAGASSDSTTSIDSSYYTLEQTAEGFKITFNESMDTAGYNYVKIEYNTEAAISKYEDGSTAYGTKYTFSNSGNIGDGVPTSGATYGYTRNNPNVNETTNLTAKKSWSDDSESNRPNNITMLVQYKVNNSDWQPLRTDENGGYLYDDDSAYATALAYTVTLNSSIGWNSTLTGLRKKVASENEDGTQGTVKEYSYRVVEYQQDGQTIQNGIFETSSGIYKSSGDGTDGIITNKFYAYNLTSITPSKTWTDETDAAKANRPNVTLQLQRKCTDADNNNTLIHSWAAFGDDVTVGTSDGDTWTGTAWSNLPQYGVEDGKVVKYTYQVVELYNGKELSRNSSSDGAKILTSNGYYTAIYDDSNYTVTNKFTGTSNLTITAKKVWKCDEDRYTDNQCTHYTDNRPTAIKVQLQRSVVNSGSWENVSDGELTLSAANNWTVAFDSNLTPNQTIEDGVLTRYEYRVVEVGYTFGDKDVHTESIDGYSKFATTENGYYEVSGTSSKISTSGDYTITNTYQTVDDFYVTPVKKWDDSDLSTSDLLNNNRPKSVTLKLQRSIDGNTWEDVTKEGSTVTVTLSSSSETQTTNEEWKGSKVEGLPREKIVINDDGTITIKTYTYRYLEIGYVDAKTNESKTLSSKAVSFSTDNGEYKISKEEFSAARDNGDNKVVVTNTFKESAGITKKLVDRNGDEFESAISTDDLFARKSDATEDDSDPLELLKTIQIDGEDYYVFNWTVKFEGTIKSNPDWNSIIKPLVDTLPEGFSLCTDGAATAEQIDSISQPADILEKKGGYFSSPYYLYPNAKFANNIKDIHTLEYKKDEYGNDIKTEKLATEQDYIDFIFNSKKSEYYYYNPDFTGTNTAYFSKPYVSQTYILCYSTKIKKTELDEKVKTGTYTITNDAQLYSQVDIGESTEKLGISDSASLKIYNKTPTNLVTKSGDKTLIPGYIRYTLDINAQGQNLSVGDQVDVTDVFNVTSYYDADFKDGTTTIGNGLLDALMNSITVYQVDANGNKTVLPKSQYTMQFESGVGTKTEDGKTVSAILKLTVPDEMHVEVDYVYKLVANENTPSVLNNCWSSSKVNGKYVRMSSGLVPPTGDKATFTNTATLKTESASDTSEKKFDDYEFFKSSGTISTTIIPTITKVNTGDYSINSLEATFLLAKYDTSSGKWVYARTITEDGTISDWSSSPTDGKAIAEDAGEISVSGTTGMKVKLSENVLYKLVEISVPSNYYGSELGLSANDFKAMLTAYLNDGATEYNGTDYSVFLDKYKAIHYFSYNSTVSKYPSEVTASDITQIKSSGEIEIPNNKLISIQVKKDWIDDTTEESNTESTTEGTTTEENKRKINVTLYWSYTKASTGIPDDAVEVVAADLGITDSDFSAEKEITTTSSSNDSSSNDSSSATWENLPNGLDDKPIYYYVKETGYTVNGKTYKLQDDGTYLLVNDEGEPYTGSQQQAGAYYPTYIGNAVNQGTEATVDGTTTDLPATVTIRNSTKLVIKKAWKNVAGGDMSESRIPVSAVTVSIYGMNENGEKDSTPIVENVELSKDNNWELDVTDLLKDKDLSQYTHYLVEETNVSGLEDYVVSCVFNLNHGTGEFTVTNKSTAPAEASVAVKKTWSDGEDQHTGDSVEVTLYQSTESGLTAAQIKADESGELATKLESVPVLGTDGEYKTDESGAFKMEDITNPLTLNKDSDWECTWTNLPISNPETDEKYYYYVVETEVTIDGDDENGTEAAKYEATYTSSTQNGKTTYTIKNTKQSIIVQKKWLDEDGTDITSTMSDNTSVTVDLYSSKNITSTLNIVAFGDSITDGYDSYSKTSKCYPSKLTTLLTDAGFTLNDGAVANKGVSGQQIGSSSDSDNTFRKRVTTDIPSDTNIVCFIGGTNDIHQIGSVKYDPKGVFDRFKACIEEIKIQSPEAMIIVGSIPHFVFYDENGNLTTGGGWWDSKYYANDGEEANKLIDEYNALIKQYAEETDGVYYVDTCTAVGTNIRDGCHPSEEGYAAIANAFYNAILVNYVPAKSSPVSSANILNAGNNWKKVIDVTDNDATYIAVESDMTGSDISNWVVSYEDNGQKAGSSTPILVTNTRKSVEKVSITVNKRWENDDATTDAKERAKINLALMRTTTPNDADSWDQCDVMMPTPTKDNETNTWTYAYTNLPKTDAAGNPYYYKIVENGMDSYNVQYYAVGGDTTKVESPPEIDVTSGDQTVYLTNTKTISLKFVKVWEDPSESNHARDVVKLTVHRSTTRDENDTQRLSLSLSKDKISTGYNKTITVESNASTTSTLEVSSDNSEVATATANGTAITITTNSVEGTATIKVSDGVQSREITVIVTPLSIELTGDHVTGNEETGYTIEAASTGTLQAKLDGEATDATFSSSDESVISIDGTTLSANKPGTATITATTEDGKSTTLTVDVSLPSTFTLTGDNEVAIGNKITLTPVENLGSFSWSSDDETIATVTGGVVTGLNPGTTTITATRTDDGATAQYNVTVLYPDVFTTSGTVNVQVYVGETVTLKSALGFNRCDWHNGSVVSTEISDGDFKITGVSAGSFDLTVYNNSDYSGKSITITVTELPSISLTADSKVINYNETLQLTSDPSDVTYTSSDPTIATVDEKGLVTANSTTGKVTIKASKKGYRDGTIVIKVKGPNEQSTGVELDARNGSVDQYISLSGTVSSVTLEFSECDPTSTNTFYYEFSNCGGNVEVKNNPITNSVWNNGTNLTATLSGNTLTLTGIPTNSTQMRLMNNGGAARAIVTYDIDYASSTQSLPHRQSLSAALSISAETLSLLSDDGAEGTTAAASDDTSTPTFNADGTYEVTLKAIDNWQCTLENLPTQDSNGNSYYYWVEETPVSNYTASYSFDDADDSTLYCINAQKVGDGVMTITNTKENTGDEGYNLPSTGGTGTKPYRLAGLFLMGGGCALTFATQFTRRRRKKCTK